MFISHQHVGLITWQIGRLSPDRDEWTRDLGERDIRERGPKEFMSKIVRARESCTLEHRERARRSRVSG